MKDRKAKAVIIDRTFRLAYGLPGDSKSVGGGVCELRIHFGPGYRIYYQKQRGSIVLLLCGGDKSSQNQDIILGKKGWLRRSMMSEPIYDYDPSDYLNSPDEIEAFLLEAFSTGDSGYIAEAIGVAAKAKGMADIARETGLSREQLYRSFSGEGNPTLKTLLVVLQALGLTLKPSSL